LAGQVASGAPGTRWRNKPRDAFFDCLGIGEHGQEQAPVRDNLAHDMATFAEMNVVWEAWVVPGATPARATVASPHLASPDFNIEIAIVAAQS
jgi:hypothetical protein